MTLRVGHRATGAPVTVHIVQGGDHFDIVEPMCRLIAGKIAADAGPTCNISITADEVRRAYAEE